MLIEGKVSFEDGPRPRLHVGERGVDDTTFVLQVDADGLTVTRYDWNKEGSEAEKRRRWVRWDLMPMLLGADPLDKP